MKAPDFDYVCPQTLDEALTLLGQADREAMLLAGGQGLMPMMNFRLSTPDVLIDLNAITDLTGIADDGDAIMIGAMTRYAELERSDLASKHLPLMMKALPSIAHSAIRNRGTIGGSVALADPAAEMPALLLALDATIIAVSADGERSVASDDFFLGLYETALHPSEIIKAIQIPKAGGARHFAFDELARRHGDYAMVGLAATAENLAPLKGVRLAFFGIGDRAIRPVAAEDALNGGALDDESALQQATEAVAGLAFDGDLNASIETKRHLAKVLLKRVLQAF